MPFAVLCSLSRFISRIHSSLFSDWRRSASSKFFDTQAPSVSTEEHVIPRHAHCTLSHPRCNGHSLLLSSCLSIIGRIENPSCSTCVDPSQCTSHLFCTVQLWTLCAARSLATLCLSTISGPGSGKFLSFWDFMVFRHAPIPWKVSGRNNNNINNRKRHQRFSQYFSVCFCNDIHSLFKEIGIEHDPRKWRLFIDCSFNSLKSVLLHNGN